MQQRMRRIVEASDLGWRTVPAHTWSTWLVVRRMNSLQFYPHWRLVAAMKVVEHGDR